MTYDISTDDYLTDDRLQTTLATDAPGAGREYLGGAIVAKWFYLVDGQQSGPVEPAELKQLASSGRLKSTDKVRREDMGQWHQASAINGLFAATQSVPATSSHAQPAPGRGPSGSGLRPPSTTADHANKNEWFYLVDGQQQGPVSVTKLKQLAGSGKLKRSDLIWKEGLAEWTAAASFTELFPAQPAPPPPPRISASNTNAGTTDDHSSWLSGNSLQDPEVPTRRVSESAHLLATTKHNVGADGPKGFAITGLILGVCGAVISITPCLWMFGAIPDVLAIIFSALALRKVKAGVAGGKGMAIAGLVCGIVAVVLWFGMMASMGKSMHELDQSLEKLRTLHH